MFEPEKVTRTATVVVVEMGVTDHVVIIALGGPQVGLEHLRQVDAGIPHVGGIAHVGVIDQHLAAVGHVDAGAVGVAEGMKGQFGCHIRLAEWYSGSK